MNRPLYEKPKTERPLVVRHGKGRLHCEAKHNLKHGYRESQVFSDQWIMLRIEIEGVLHEVELQIDEARALHQELSQRLSEASATEKAVEQYRAECEAFFSWEPEKDKEKP